MTKEKTKTITIAGNLSDRLKISELKIWHLKNGRSNSTKHAIMDAIEFRLKRINTIKNQTEKIKK